MPDYLAFSYSWIDELKNAPYNEGVTLAKGCLTKIEKLDNQKRFPPSLLILLTSPEYIEQEKAERMLAGIHDIFDNSYRKEVPLIGSSVASVFCDQVIYRRGALLVCLASRLMSAQVAVGEQARQNPKEATANLLDELGLDSNSHGQIDPNPLANRLLLTFLPGFKVKDGEEYYPAPELYQLLRAGVKTRIRIMGGVCSVGDIQRASDGLLYAGRRAYKDVAVAAMITSGISIGVSLNYGFEPTNKVLKVEKVGKNGRTVLGFENCSPAELFKEESPGIRLVKLSTDFDEPTIDLPQLSEDRESIQLLHRVRKDDYFQVVRPDEEKILGQFEEGFIQSQKRTLIEKPIASLILAGRAWFDFLQPTLGLNKALKFVKQLNIDCVGGFFDGEMGVDKSGRSLFINGASSCLTFGDEMRERTPLYQGVEALARFGPDLNDSSVDKVIETALKIVVKTGFPGAMISLILPHQESYYIVADKAIGRRFEKVVEMTRRPLSGNDILALVARNAQAEFISDSRIHPDWDPQAITISGIISQYVLPLRRLDGTVFGILQVDLGDLSHQTKEEFIKTEKGKILNSLAEIFGAGLNRIAQSTENEIILHLDQALQSGLSASTLEEGLQQFIEAACKTFGVGMGHIRLAAPKDTLSDSSKEPALILVAGYGDFYTTGKKIRREISSPYESPIYAAFRDETLTIVNDVSESKHHKALLERVSASKGLSKAVEKIKSYAAVAFKNEKGEKIGALSLASDKLWFFTESHRRTIEALAQRVAFLIRNLESRSRLEFLFKVSTNLSEIDFDEIPAVLEETLGRFCDALNAEVASLYLWDKDREKFILRAQHGWKTPEWVNAANYKRTDKWMGVKAAKPLYIKDLNKFYKEQPGKGGGRYVRYMFGQPLSDDYTVEAIGLPLKIGSKQEKFGILTLYRHIEPREASGFLSTHEKLLEEGAYKMAGLVNALVEHGNDVWHHTEQARHQAVYEAISPFESKEEFELKERVEWKACQRVLEIYEAEEVSFYKAEEQNATAVSWAAGYRRNSDTQSFEEMAEVEPDDLVKKAVTKALDEKKQKKVTSQRWRLKSEGRDNPEDVAREGLVERICIPLTDAQHFVGILDIRWNITYQQAGSLHVRHSFNKLRQLGLMIGSTYRRHQLAKEVEQSKLAVQVTGAYVFQRAHRLINAIQTLYRLAQAIKQAKPEDREAKIRILEERSEQYIETIRWTMDLGERVQNPVRQKLLVYEIIKESLEETDIPKERKKKVELNVSNNLVVMAVPPLLKEVFVNLINNAFDAMEEQEHPILNISATICKDMKNVEIVFEDNGVGMTLEQINNAEKGFVAMGTHKSTGVLISRVLAMVQGGVLRYESVKGKGTKAIVTLAAIL